MFACTCALMCVNRAYVKICARIMRVFPGSAHKHMHIMCTHLYNQPGLGAV